MVWGEKARLKEAKLAREWRERQGFTRAICAELTGYSASMIQDIESGEFRGKGLPVKESDYHKYRLACAAIANDLADWDWE